MWRHIFNVVRSSYNQSDPWLICIRSDIIEGLKCFIQASVGSIPFVKIITAYSLNCSLQNVDMHGHELFMAMDENRDWKLNFSQTDNVSKTCSQDRMSVWFNYWTCNWMFSHSLVQTFSCSAVQTFRRISSLSIDQMIIQTVNRMNEQSFKWPLMNYFWLWMTIWIKI